MGIFHMLFGDIFGSNKKKQDEIEKRVKELDSKIEYFDPKNPVDGDKIVIKQPEWGKRYVKKEDGSIVETNNYSRHELVLKSEVTAHELVIWWVYQEFSRENWVSAVDRWGFIIYPKHGRAHFLNDDQIVNKIPWMCFFIKTIRV